MNDDKALLERLGRVGAHIAPELTDREVERLVAGGLRRRRQKNVVRGAAALVLVGALAAALVFMRAPHSPRSVSPEMVAIPTSVPPVQPLHFGDGSMATPLDPGAVLSVVHDAPDKVVLDLLRGRARFEVVSRHDRPFVIQSGSVRVSVVGTLFTVERVADRVGVSVERGTVRVDWGTGGEDLSDGHSGWYPPLVIRTSPSVSADVRPGPPKLHLPASAEAPSGTMAPETAETLLQAADRSRIEGRPEQGAALLRRVLREHRGDPRAPLAAFTLGRVLLMELGQPREAAAAFAEVRTLAPGTEFAEDALAREVEAWKRAGDRGSARARAQEYIRLYPEGLRAEAVKAFGGIE